MGNKNSKIDTAKIVTRCFAVRDFRAASAISANGNNEDADEKELSGHAAVFDSVTSIGGWWNETIARGAFDACDFDDVYCFSSIICRIKFHWLAVVGIMEIVRCNYPLMMSDFS
jgi:hypothetical protein